VARRTVIFFSGSFAASIFPAAKAETEQSESSNASNLTFSS
jgi:hypothetical protein